MDTEIYMSITRRVSLRFVRGFIAGAVSAIALVSIGDAASWSELGTVLMNLIFALISGGLTGGLMAVDKWVRDIGSSKKN